jgi:hypothetical protein
LGTGRKLGQVAISSVKLLFVCPVGSRHPKTVCRVRSFKGF